LTVTIDTATFNILKDDPVSVSISITNCLPFSTSNSWTQTSGPSFDILSYASNNDEDISIPACSLTSNEQYKFRYDHYYDDDASNEKISVMLEINVSEYDFGLSIDSPDEILSNQDLEISTSITSACPVTYLWTCQIQNKGQGSFQDCENFDDYFGNPSSSLTSISLTPDYYNPEDVLNITLTLTSGQDTQTFVQIVQVKSYLEVYLADPDTSCQFKLALEIDPSEAQANIYEYEWS